MGSRAVALALVITGLVVLWFESAHLDHPPTLPAFAEQQRTPTPVRITDEERAVRRARQYPGTIFGDEPLARGRVELRASDGGWIVIFRDIEGSCGQSGWWS